MLGDPAVAAHPPAERYAGLVGRELLLPLQHRRIPVVADPFVDPAFATGAVKVTPAHDPNDFAAARRLGLDEVVVIDTAGKMTSEAGEFAGLDRALAREHVVARLTELGLVTKVQEHEHAVGHCQRCHEVVEPLVSTQWFVKIEPLAAPAIRAVEEADDNDGHLDHDGATRPGPDGPQPSRFVHHPYVCLNRAHSAYARRDNQLAGPRRATD